MLIKAYNIDWDSDDPELPGEVILDWGDEDDDDVFIAETLADRLSDECDHLVNSCDWDRVDG